MKFSAAVVLLACVASIHAAPAHRLSNMNRNVNINTNTNTNQNYNSIYASLLSQLTNNQIKPAGGCGGRPCGGILYDPVVAEPEVEPTIAEGDVANDEDNADDAGLDSDDAELDSDDAELDSDDTEAELDMAGNTAKGKYLSNKPNHPPRPTHRPQISNSNYNRNYNKNTNTDYNSIFSSLFEQLKNQQKIQGKKTAVLDLEDE